MERKMERYVRVDFEKKTKRLPVCFCIDISGSMDFYDKKFGWTNVENSEQVFVDGEWANIAENGTTYMQEVQDGLELFYQAIKEDDFAYDVCESAIVTFNDTPTKIEDFSFIKDKQAPNLIDLPQGDTYIYEALEMCLDMLKDRKLYYKENRIPPPYTPWLVIFSDGKANDDETRIQKIQEKLMDLQDRGKLIVYTMAIKEEKEFLEQLSGYSTRKPILCNKVDTIKKFFEFMSRSVSSSASGAMFNEEFNG
ncbi:MAG: VWA domain-containing protein [Clostridiales bacterium]|nr:VWA domain-containing protein [Clostridiales bacterium]